MTDYERQQHLRAFRAAGWMARRDHAVEHARPRAGERMPAYGMSWEDHDREHGKDGGKHDA